MHQPTQILFKRGEFIAVTAIGSMAMLLIRAFYPDFQLAALGLLFSILGGLVISFLGHNAERQIQTERLLDKLQIPMRLATDAELYSQYASYAASFNRIASDSHSSLRRLTLMFLSVQNQRLDQISRGIVEFGSTEAWRATYEDLLNPENVKIYRSVSVVNTPSYWQDAGGKRSTQKNIEDAGRGMKIERIVVLHDDLWPGTDGFSNSNLDSWLRRQKDAGISIFLIQSSVLTDESLRVDFGIYGDVAIGIQEIGVDGRTQKFSFDFRESTKNIKDGHWRQLMVHSIALDEIYARSSDDPNN